MKKMERSDSIDEKALKSWIGEFLGKSIDEEKNFKELLKDGIILCSIMNKIVPNFIQIEDPSQEVENVSLYIQSCSTLGFDRNLLFEIEDLIEGQNMEKVLNNLRFIYKHSEKMIEVFSSPVHDQYNRIRQLRITHSTPNDLSYKDDLKYNPELERMARNWIESVIGETLPDPSLHRSLKSGVILCRLINKIKPNTITKINSSSISFKQMDNIGLFIKACRDLGMRPNDVFTTIDLFEAKGMSQVISCIHVLARHCKKIPDFQGPFMEIEQYSKTRSAYSASLRITRANHKVADWLKSHWNDINAEEEIQNQKTIFWRWFRQKKQKEEKLRDVRNIDFNQSTTTTTQPEVAQKQTIQAKEPTSSEKLNEETKKEVTKSQSINKQVTTEIEQQKSNETKQPSFTKTNSKNELSITEEPIQEEQKSTLQENENPLTRKSSFKGKKANKFQAIRKHHHMSLEKSKSILVEEENLKKEEISEINSEIDQLLKPESPKRSSLEQIKRQLSSTEVDTIQEKESPQEQIALQELTNLSDQIDNVPLGATKKTISKADLQDSLLKDLEKFSQEFDTSNLLELKMDLNTIQQALGSLKNEQMDIPDALPTPSNDDLNNSLKDLAALAKMDDPKKTSSNVDSHKPLRPRKKKKNIRGVSLQDIMNDAPKDLNDRIEKFNSSSITPAFVDIFHQQDEEIESLVPWNSGDPVIRSFSVREDLNKSGMRRSKKKVQQEDQFVAEFPFAADQFKGLFCVFDGHGGKECAIEAKTYFPKIFLDQIGDLSNLENASKAFVETYLATDQQLKEFEYMGTTATTVFVWQYQGSRYLQAANVGDSTAYLFYENNLIQLTKDHKPGDPDERERLIQAGANLSNGALRLYGLSVSRALGDHFFKSEQTGLIAEPTVSPVYKIDSPATLIVASDGLWDVMSGQEAMNLIHKLTARQGASHLLTTALSDSRCVDNTTVIVARL